MTTIEKFSSTIELFRARILVRGAVQGVGFRPFVYRLSRALAVNGWVSNTSEGVVIEAEGERKEVEAMISMVKSDAPGNAVVESVDWIPLEPAGYAAFEIRRSLDSGKRTVQVLPDLNMCGDCAADIFDPSNRRHYYPFTNCTRCGPRFSIIESLPYDRRNTTMRSFGMCDNCREEYENPSDRRFHAQPNACPECGPQVSLWSRSGSILAVRREAIQKTAEALRKGKIAAVKGVGGFHLMVDAQNAAAVRELRKRKHRGEKPFAVMCPGLHAVKRVCEVSVQEESLLVSAAAPVVILNRAVPTSPRRQAPWLEAFSGFAKMISGSTRAIAEEVAPGNPTLGVMLPYSPLHALLLRELNGPVVATSGNLSEEPICFDENRVLEKLGQMADLFLIHDRPIARAMDDSVVRVIMGKPFILRAGRGYAPVSIPLGEDVPAVLGLGGQLKSTVAVSAGQSVFVSQHLGDMESQDSVEAFQEARQSLMRLYEIDPEIVAADMHPGYFSTQTAKETGLSPVLIQHHHAHVASCMAEHGLKSRVLGVAWDGTGFGADGTIWGGEFLVADRARFNRVGSMRKFRLPGGESAVREPRRSALGVLYEIFGEKAFSLKNVSPLKSFSRPDLKVLRQMLLKQTNAPVTSSAGRLFDAVSALINLTQVCSFEGQAAMALEFALSGEAGGESDGAAYRFPLQSGGNGSFVIDWEPMIRDILADLHNRVPPARISLKFHNALVESIVSMAQRVKIREVVLSGGCFQNKYLLEKSARSLQAEGFTVYWPQRVPANDGGLSLGQVASAVAQLQG